MDEVRLAIQNSKKSFTRKSSLLLGAILIGSLMLYILLGENNTTINLYFLGAIFVLVLYILFFVKAYDLIGHVTLTKEEILIEERSEGDIIASLFDLSGLTFEYNAYKGKIYYSTSPFSDAGVDNMIQFMYKGKLISKKLLITHKDVLMLNALFSIWKAKGIKFEITNYKKEKLKKLSI